MKTLSFNTARKKLSAFSTMVKPVGSACNFHCAYCYYLDKADIYGGKEPVMNEELLDLYIRQYFEAVDTPTITFCWHGGEPLIAGIDFFRKAIALQERYRGERQVENTLQTNGMLVNDEWCDFFRENRFLVGLSIDGPQDIHDAFRSTRGGQQTFEHTVRAARLMINHGVEFNILCTVNSTSVGRGKDVYNFLKDATPFLQFLPVHEYINDEGKIVPPGTDNSHLTPFSVTAEGFGKFMCDVYDEWVRHDVGSVFVQLFDNTLAQWCGQQSGLCALNETCGDSIVVEHNGDVYCCDHFVYPQYRLGNINETSLAEMRKADKMFDFGAMKYSGLPRMCQHCKWLFLCHGECPKHRFATTSKGDSGLNSLCKGYKMFFEHTADDMKYMRAMLEKGLAPALIMKEKQGICGNKI